MIIDVINNEIKIINKLKDKEERDAKVRVIAF